MTQTAPRPESRLPLRPRLTVGARHLRRRPPLLREVYGRLIRRLRSRQGRTLTDVARRAGVSVAYLSEIERGLKEPSSEVLEAVCTALDSSITHLVGAAHRELVLQPGSAGLRVAGLENDDFEEGYEPIEAGVLDLTRRSSGGSGVADEPTVAAPTRFGEASLIAA
ncbi:MAG: helix-turn-helix domain-containing protein [Humibacillus sp.]|nr:helix-turn-helix domain-containing protein [Humibacillus sp.]MDN5776618.1 helix-turn-helix domain-containing protein [Humibacillus sp.]